MTRSGRFCGLLIIALLLACSNASGTRADSWLLAQNFQLTDEIQITAIKRDASGLAYDPVMDSLWLVHDDPPTLYLLDTDGNVRQRFPLEGMDDPEAIAWLGSVDGVQTRLAISEERRGQVVEVVIDHSSTKADNILAQLDKQGSNSGIEGLAYDSELLRLWLATEFFPRAVYMIAADTQLREQWRLAPWQSPWDYSGMTYLPGVERLLVVSDRSRQLVEYDLQGREIARLAITETENPEGVALATDGRLFICAEPNRLYIYSPAAKTQGAE